MPAAIDLAGRVAKPKATVPGRLVVAIMVVFALFGAVVLFTLHKKMVEKQRRLDAIAEETSAPDAAESNRASVEANDDAVLGKLQKEEKSDALPPFVAPLADAAKDVVQPFGQQPPAWQPQQKMTPEELEKERQRKALERRQARLEQAIDAPTGADTQRTAAAAPAIDTVAAQNLALDDEVRRRIGDAQQRIDAMGGHGPDPYRAQNAQDEKAKFNLGSNTQGDDVLKSVRLPPYRWAVTRGDSIPATLSQHVGSDLPGDVYAQVSRHVYDSASGKFVMIPAGSRVIGEYNPNVSYGQKRVQVVWTAIRFLDGSIMDLDRFPSHSADGTAGLKDKVDNHWPRILGGVLISSVLAAGLQISQNRTNGSVLTYPSTGQEAAAAIGTQSAQLGQQITSRNLNIQPTLIERMGQEFAIEVKRDMLFSGPYEPMEAK